MCHLLTSNFYPQTPFLTPHLPLENLSSVTDHSTSCVFPLSSTDSQRSHLSTITMILKDKFHSPKIKRTPSKKGKQLQPETAAKSTEKPTNKVCVFVCASRHVCIVGNPTLSRLFRVFVCLFARRLFSCQMFCAPLFHCVRTWVSLLVPTASQSLWRLAVLQQVSKPIKARMEPRCVVNELC